MKREEMIKLIANELWDMYSSDETRVDQFLKQAELILEVVEKAGMKPPQIIRFLVPDDTYEWEK